MVFPISASLTDPATRARHADDDSICDFSTRRRGGISGFPLQRANPTSRLNIVVLDPAHGGTDRAREARAASARVRSFWISRFRFAARWSCKAFKWCNAAGE